MGCGCSNQLTHTQEQDIKHNQELKELLKQFNSPSEYVDSFNTFPRFHQLQCIQSLHKKNHSLILCTIPFKQSEQIPTTQCWVEKYNLSNHPNKIMIHCHSIIHQKSHVEPTQNFQMLLDKPIISLAQHPLLLQQQPLDEGEIWFILDCISAALAHSQMLQIRVDNITLDDIYSVMSPFGEQIYKLLDSQWSQSEKEISPSPDLDNDMYKNSTYLLGLLCLQCMDLVPTELQMFQNKQMNLVPVLESRLNDLYSQKKASIILIKQLENMLFQEQYHRPDCLSLNDQITKIYSGAFKQRLLSIHEPNEFFYRTKLTKDELDSSSYIPTQDDFLSCNDDPKYLVSLTQQNKLESSNTQEVKLETSNWIVQDISGNKQDISKYSPDLFQIEHIKSNTEEIYNEDGVLLQSTSKLTDTYKLSNSDITFNLRSKSQSGFLAYPFPISISISHSNSIKAFSSDAQLSAKLSYSNGSYYEGQIQQKQRAGQGTLFNEFGDKLVDGNWFNDMPQGSSVLFNYPNEKIVISHEDISSSQWVRYEGLVEVGFKSGQGKLLFNNGDCFDGQFEKDKVQTYKKFQVQGEGVYIYVSGIKVSGIWENNKFIK